MWDACKLLWSLFLGLFRSRASLEAENLALRQQIIVLQRTAPKRLCFNRQRNAPGARVNWMFTTEKARAKWARLSQARSQIRSTPKSQNLCVEVLGGLTVIDCIAKEIAQLIYDD